MQLIDKDLLSMQEVRELVEAAKEAQRELAGMSQEQVDHIVRAIADAGVRNARRLAQMANEDTGFGIVDDKVIKNIFASRGVYEYISMTARLASSSAKRRPRLRAASFRRRTSATASSRRAAGTVSHQSQLQSAFAFPG